MNINNGYFIVEFLMYLCIYAVLSVLMMRFVATTGQSLNQSFKKTVRVMTAYSAFDGIEHDININDSFVCENDVLKCVSKYCQVSWIIDQERLVRVEKKYNKEKSRWQKPGKSIITNHCSRISFKDYVKNRFIDVTVTIVLSNRKTYTIKQKVSYKKGLTV